VDADAVEIRVLGCLIEKQRTTPDVYPLTLNALRAACNQSTNRDPVVDYDERTIRAALERLDRKRWTRLASGAGSRSIKYRHLLGEELSLDAAAISLLCVLMLRGPQTPGELKGRSERLHRFGTLDDVETTLAALIERGLAARLPRRPGQKEQRFAQLLGGEEGVAEDAAEPWVRPPADSDEARVEALEARVDRLEDEVASLRSALESVRDRRV
jgi:uncharacterized protein YceH (UPF0502 family)